MIVSFLPYERDRGNHNERETKRMWGGWGMRNGGFGGCGLGEGMWSREPYLPLGGWRGARKEQENKAEMELRAKSRLVIVGRK